MNKMIVYGIRDGKLWMGRPTFLSWVRCLFRRGWMLAVKPIRGWERYAHYPDVLYISPEYANFTNEDFGATPLASVMIAEKHKGHEVYGYKPWQEK